MQHTLVLDLETLPVANAADFVTTDDISAPSNWKDAEKIAAYVAEKRAERIASAALDLDLARICAIGTINCDTGEVDAAVCQTEDEEREALGVLAAELTPDAQEWARIITFNGFKYDLPLLMRRARYLGVTFPRLNLDRYRSPHVDLYEELTLRGAIKAHGLRWYMRRLGWTDLLEADPLPDGGANVGDAIAAGRWADVEAHVLVDIEATRRLAQWLGFVQEPF